MSTQAVKYIGPEGLIRIGDHPVQPGEVIIATAEVAADLVRDTQIWELVEAPTEQEP